MKNLKKRTTYARWALPIATVVGALITAFAIWLAAGQDHRLAAPSQAPSVTCPITLPATMGGTNATKVVINCGNNNGNNYSGSGLNSR
jgi:hypothetical protein